MKSLRIQNFGNAVRIGALCGSAIAALLCGIAFATDKPLYCHYEEILTGNSDYFGVRIFLGLLLGVFLSYLLATSKRFAMAGSLLAIGAVGCMYVWHDTSHNVTLDPFVAVLAIPAFLHILAVRSEGRAIEDEVVSLPSNPVHVQGALEPA